MRGRPKHIFIEWGFVVFTTLLCATLTVLQYRWTGEIAEAELARLNANLDYQAKLLCREFDTEFSANVKALLPTPGELRELGRDGAHVLRFRNWLASKPALIFRRMAITASGENGPRLLGFEKDSGRMVPTEWPPEWGRLKENVSRRSSPGPFQQPYLDRTGVIHDYQISDGTWSRDRRTESQRLIVELDLLELRNVWFPAMVKKFLNVDGATAAEAEVRFAIPPETDIYVSSDQPVPKQTEGVVVRFNHGGVNEKDPQVSGVRSLVGVGGVDGWWVFRAWHRPGTLEALIATSRARNVAVAAVLNALVLVASALLVYHTRRVRKLSEAEMNFVASVSHELRTPLTVITTAADNLSRGVVRNPSSVQQYASLITQHAGQLAELVGQILEFSAVRKKQLLSRFAPVPLATVLEAAAAAAGADLQAARCTLAWDLPGAVPAVLGDGAALARAFQNLLSNAAKHGGAGGWVGVAVAVQEGPPAFAEVRVADRGPGIPAGEAEEIFEPFFRGSGAVEKQVRGSGLGLSLVREIVEAHGGTVTVETRAEPGAAFVVRLPISPA